MDSEDITNRFGYHPPKSTARVKDHEFVRDTLEVVAHKLNSLLGEGREKSTCITKLEEAMFWANASLARAHDPNATASEEEAAAGPKVNLLSNRLGQGEPALDRDDEERSSSGPAPHPFEMVDLPDVYDPYTCKRCGEHKEDEIHRDPREGLDPDEQLCAVVLYPGGQCSLPAFGHIVMGGRKRKPMCEYHWREDDSGHPKERIR